MTQANEHMTKVRDKLSSIQSIYDQGHYGVVVKECCSLFEMAFKKIFKDALATFNYQDRLMLSEAEQAIGAGKKGVDKFCFGELVGLNEKAHLLSKWSEYNNIDMGLINAFKFRSFVDLRNSLTHTDVDMTASCNPNDAILIFNCLRNMLTTLGYMNIEGPDTPPTPPDTTGEEELVNIALNRKRGIIINKSDETRNISYKVDTINRMLSVVYTKVSAMTSESDATQLLYDMGYDSGSAFGRVMNERWGLKDNLSLNDKITMWCDFDSEVGWGRFVNNLIIEEETGELSGTIDITENFLCYNRKKNDVKICDFLKGYCEGVIEELLDGQQVTLTCCGDACPLKNALKKKCSYEVKIAE